MFSNNFNFEIMTNVISGINSLDKIISFLNERNFKKVALILDKNLYKNSKYVRNFCKKLKKKKLAKKTLLFEGISEPTYQELDKTIIKLRKNKKNIYDCLIGIGGGSTIDYAKGLAILIKNPGNSITYRGFPKKLNSPVPIVAVPSTTGTGSELAYNAVFTDLKSGVKLGINSKNNYPALSILDPKVTKNSPDSVILNSSLGALTRSIDTMFNKKCNEISKIFSENSFKLLVNNLPKVLKNKKNLENWSKMQWGSYFSVASLLNSSSGPAGVISYYLSTNFNIPQGIGYAVSGINFFKRNHKKGFFEYSKVFDLIDNSPSKKIFLKKEKSAFVLNKISQILKSNKKNLKKTFFPENTEKKILKLFQNKNNPIINNPVKLSKKDLKIIIEKTLNQFSF